MAAEALLAVPLGQPMPHKPEAPGVLPLATVRCCAVCRSFNHESLLFVSGSSVTGRETSRRWRSLLLPYWTCMNTPFIIECTMKCSGVNELSRPWHSFPTVSTQQKEDDVMQQILDRVASVTPL